LANFFSGVPIWSRALSFGLDGFDLRDSPQLRDLEFLMAVFGTSSAPSPPSIGGIYSFQASKPSTPKYYGIPKYFENPGQADDFPDICFQGPTDMIGDVWEWDPGTR
jgi:hypothetical protein